jgi:hypothetical protein
VSSISTIIPVPPAVRDRTWELAWVLTQEFADRLLDDRGGGDARRVVRADPARVDWGQAGTMRRLFSRLVEVRT